MNEIKALTKEDIKEIMMDLGVKARGASHGLAAASTKQKNAALSAMAHAIRAGADEILAANEKDMAAAADKNLKDSFQDRLLLSAERIEAIAKGVEEIAELDDPVGKTSAQWDRPNGLNISRVQVPLGVIGIIYESRPNVTVDAGALCLKSGNAVILRGGSESFHSSSALVQALHAGLREAGLPHNAIQMVPTTDRNAVSDMLTGLGGNLDLIIPRGGKNLIERIQNEARIPVFSHLEGICHTYIDAAANLNMAVDVVMNAKLRRTGICGAAETLLIDQACVDTHFGPITDALLEAGCEIRGDELSVARDQRIKPASEDDWSTEYLDTIISLKIVDGVNAAVDHIEKYGSHHTDAIITDDDEAATRFLNNVHSAIVMHNTSTQFADGGEFGMGAEIGIATGKMHARGPVGVEQLTTYKYVVRSDGQTRP
jgi:glutamate-5-semialdehyde dehydrogenase